MALPANVTWEVRPGAGNAANGGGFVDGGTGTDFSQQNAAQYSFTDLVIDGTTNTIVRSASHTFGSTDVDNLMSVSAGSSWSLGIYRIVSVSGGDATLDRSPGATSLTGGTFAVGGALDTTTSIITRSGIGGTTQGVAGNKIYVKATGAVSFGASQVNFDLPFFTIIGYNTTRGDGGRVSFTTATNSVELLVCGNNSYTVLLYNIDFSNTASSRNIAFEANGVDLGYLYMENCSFDGFSNALVLIQVGHFVANNVEVKNCTGHGIVMRGRSMRFIDSYIHDNGDDGLDVNGTNNGGAPGSLTLIRTKVRNNTTHGIRNFGDGDSSGAVDLLLENSAILGNGSDGIRNFGTGTNYAQMVGLVNTIIFGNIGVGINLQSSLSHFPPVYYGGSNAFGDNGTDRTNFPTLEDDIVITADPFTNQSTGDFSLNGTAGAGADCKGAGTHTNLDIGPEQSAGGGGGGGGSAGGSYTFAG